MTSPVRRTPARPSRTAYLAIVRTGEVRVFNALRECLGRGDQVLWDRRLRERRVSRQAVPLERRRGERRQPAPPTWRALGFLLVPRELEEAGVAPSPPLVSQWLDVLQDVLRRLAATAERLRGAIERTEASVRDVERVRVRGPSGGPAVPGGHCKRGPG